MIFDFLINGVLRVVMWLIGAVLPNWSVYPDGFLNGIQTAFHYFFSIGWMFDFIIPVDTVVTIMFGYIAILIPMWILKSGMWLINKIPFIGK
jgi:hypothetical protein